MFFCGNLMWYEIDRCIDNVNFLFHVIVGSKTPFISMLFFGKDKTNIQYALSLKI